MIKRLQRGERRAVRRPGHSRARASSSPGRWASTAVARRDPRTSGSCARERRTARGPSCGDIATVEDAHEEVRVITRFNGKPCVKLSVLKQADANTVEVAEAVGRTDRGTRVGRCRRASAARDGGKPGRLRRCRRWPASATPPSRRPSS
ncbi:MAG: efflux RND transporter permease subunit [Desulfobacterales bacterium]|nr:efflux RND transporter permease subunit [Desulfobacterales bacterium]